VIVRANSVMSRASALLVSGSPASASSVPGARASRLLAPASRVGRVRIGRAWLALAVLLPGAALWLARPVPVATAVPPVLPLLAPGDIVRIQLDRPGDPRLEGRWLDGRAAVAPLGCTLVLLDGREREVGASSVRLTAVRHAQRADASGGWTPLPLQRLRSGEPASCARA